MLPELGSGEAPVAGEAGLSGWERCNSRVGRRRSYISHVEFQAVRRATGRRATGKRKGAGKDLRRLGDETGLDRIKVPEMRAASAGTGGAWMGGAVGGFAWEWESVRGERGARIEESGRRDLNIKAKSGWQVPSGVRAAAACWLTGRWIYDGWGGPMGEGC